MEEEGRYGGRVEKKRWWWSERARQKLEVRREELLGAPEGGRVETNLYHAFERGT